MSKLSRVLAGLLVGTLGMGMGMLLATGDVLQIGRGGTVEKRTVFQFTDGSVFEESVVFTDLDVYNVQSCRLLRRGPAFFEDIEISLERASGKYHVTTTAHEDGEVKKFEGVLGLLSDVYNGMILTVVKDLLDGAGETVHYVAFTPKPRMIQVEDVAEARRHACRANAAGPARLVHSR